MFAGNFARRHLRSTVRRLLRRSASRTARAVLLEAVEGRRLLAATTISGTVGVDTSRDGVADTSLNAPYSVFADYNYNGKPDAGEPFTTGTGSNYRLTVDARPFALRLAVPPGLATTQPANNQPYYFELSNGVPKSWGSNFVLNGQATLLRTAVVTDLEQNGKSDSFDPDKPFADLWVDTNRNGTHDANEPKLESFFTGNGDPGFHPTAYETAVGVGGTYRIAVRLAGDADLIADRTLDVTASDPQLNFAPLLFAPKTSVVTGRLFDDKNGNGVFDGQTEAHYQGAGITRIYVDLDNNGVFNSGEPEATFDLFGPYAIEVGNRAGVLRVDPTTLRPGMQVAPASRSFDFTGVTGSQLKAGQDFRVVSGTTPSNTTTLVTHVYRDTNHNGTIDPAEAVAANGSAGQTVWADYDYDGVIDAGEPSAISDATGTATLAVQNKAFVLRVKTSTGTTVVAPNGAAYYFGVTNGVAQTWTSNIVFGVTPPSPGGDATRRIVVYVKLNGIEQAVGSGWADEAYYRFFEGTYSFWIDGDRDGVRDADEALIGRPIEIGGSYYNELSTLVAPGTYRIAASTSSAVGAKAVATSDVTTNPSESAPTSTTFNLPTTGPVVWGRLFADTDRDGVLDSNEYVLNGNFDTGRIASIWADYDQDGVRDADEPLGTVTFEGDGSNAEFNGIFVLRPAAGRTFSLGVAGRYASGVSYPLPRTTAAFPITLAANATPVLADVGFDVAYQGLPVYVYVDKNRDGRIDSGEAVPSNGAAGQIVYADYNNNGVLDPQEAFAEIGSDGSAILRTESKPFTLRLQTKAGSTQSTPASNGGFNYVLKDGTPVGTGNTFGVVSNVTAPTTSILVRIYRDTNNNGTIDPAEAVAANGAAGQTVWADYDYDGLIDAGEPSAISDATGTATLNVQNKAFVLRVKTTTGTTVVAPNGSAYYFGVTNGVATTWTSNIVFGVSVPVTSGPFVAGVVFFDANLNGHLDPGELGAGAGFIAFADLNGNGIQDPGLETTSQAVTDANGNYLLRVPSVGPVAVVFNPRDGYTFVSRGAFMIAGAGEQTQTKTGINGAVRPGFTPGRTTLSVRAQVDLNKNGQVDGNEQNSGNGVVSQTIFADYDYDGLLDAGEDFVTTDSDGRGTLSVLNKPFALRILAASGYTTSYPSNPTYFYEVHNGELTSYTPFGNTFALIATATSGAPMRTSR